MLLQGQLLGSYRLVRLIGNGGMGEVYLAEDPALHRQIAIKVIRLGGTYLNEQTVKKRIRLFQQEAQAVALLDHPNILPLYAYGKETVEGRDHTYLVMPFRPEGSLETWLRQYSPERLLSLSSVEYLVRQAASALQYAHDHQIIHQDVKPSNFLVRYHVDQPSYPDLLLADFGIAKFTNAATSGSQSLHGTYAYMAPEQWDNHSVPATDQYALAIMAYELLTGRLPFQGRPVQMMKHHLDTKPVPPSTLSLQLPRDLDKVLLQALAKKPERRFSSISAFASAFQKVLRDHHLPCYTASGNIPSSRNMNTFVSLGQDATSTSRQNPLTPPAQIPSASLAAPKIPLSPLKPQERRSPVITPGENKSKLSRSSSFWGRGMLLLGLLLILIMVGVGWLLLVFSHQRASSSVHLTPVTSANAVGEQLNPYPPYRGKPALNDPLSNNSKGYGWEIVTNSGTDACQFTGGAYHVIESYAPAVQTCHSTVQARNFAFEVHMQILKGDCGGITFRADPTTHSNFYHFEVCQDGKYTLEVYGQSSYVQLAHGSSSVITTGLGQSNLIAVVANGSTLDLYVNDQKIDSAQDSTYSQGQIGVDAGNYKGSTHVVYSDAREWTF